MYFFEMGYAADSMVHFAFFVGKWLGMDVKICVSRRKKLSLNHV